MVYLISKIKYIIIILTIIMFMGCSSIPTEKKQELFINSVELLINIGMTILDVYNMKIPDQMITLRNNDMYDKYCIYDDEQLYVYFHKDKVVRIEKIIK